MVCHTYALAAIKLTDDSQFSISIIVTAISASVWCGYSKRGSINNKITLSGWSTVDTVLRESGIRCTVKVDNAVTGWYTTPSYLCRWSAQACSALQRDTGSCWYCRVDRFHCQSGINSVTIWNTTDTMTRFSRPIDDSRSPYILPLSPVKVYQRLGPKSSTKIDSDISPIPLRIFTWSKMCEI